MSFIKKLKKIERLDGLIRRKATGSPKDLARRIDVAESTIYEYIKLMRDMGAPIEFDRFGNTYYYTTTIQFQVGFVVVNNEYMVKAQGGSNKISGFINRLRNFQSHGVYLCIRKRFQRDILQTL